MLMQSPGQPEAVSRPLPRDVLDLLACPACYQTLVEGPARLTCVGCGRGYPLVDGIPILLVDRASLPG